MAAGTVAVLSMGMALVLFPAQTSGVLDELDEDLVRAAGMRLQATVDRELEHLESMATVWASRDTTHEFVRGRDPDYPSRHLLPRTLREVGADALVVLDLTGQPVVALRLEDDAVTPSTSPAVLEAAAGAYVALDLGDPLGSTSGLVEAGADVWAVGAAAVNDPTQGSPTSGVLVWAVLVDDEVLARWAPGMQAQPTLTTLPPDAAPQLVGDELTWRVPVPTIAGPELFLECRHPRAARLAGSDGIRAIRWLVVGFGVLATAVFGIWIDRSVVRRIRRLGEEVDAVGVDSDADDVTVAGGDEVTTVATSVNDLLSRARRSRDEVAQRNLELEAANRARETFVSMISHELRTPLTSIRGFAETLTARWDGLDDTQRLMLIRRIDQQAETLDGLVGDLLTLRKAGQGRTIDPEPAIVDDALVAIVDGLPTHLSDHVRLSRDARGAAIPLGREDLRRVVTNLLMNAQKYGEPPYDIVSTLMAGKVRITVTDRGQGVRPAFVADLFEPFTQAESGDGRARRGVGLGLSIVRSLVESAGGSITYRDGPAGGAQFVVDLPLMTAAAPARPTAGASSSED